MLTTDNLKLPLYEPTDLADLTDGYNSAMNILDENDSALAENISTTADKITNGYKAADIEIKNEIKDINAIVTDQETLISNNTTSITSNNAKIQALQKAFKFTTKRYSASDVTVTSPNTTLKHCDIYLSYNSDFSLFKIYGEVLVSNSVDNNDVITIDIPIDLGSNSQYTIKPAGRLVNYADIGYAYLHIFEDNTNKIALHMGGPTSLEQKYYLFWPTLYINSNFGNSTQV